jgi:hypothetical protein
MMFPVSRRPRLLLAGFLAIAAGASGCSSNDEGSRQAGGLGTRICIINFWTDTVRVKFTNKDTDTGTGPLRPNNTFCAEGTKGVLPDVDGTLVFPEPARALYFGAVLDNRGDFLPVVSLGQFAVNDPQPSMPEKFCLGPSFKVGDDALWDNGTIRVTISRLPDDQWKEFNLVIKPSQGQRIGDDPCSKGLFDG